MKIVIARRIFPELLEKFPLSAQCIHHVSDEVWSRDEFLQHARTAEALIITMTERIDADFLAQCPRLKIIATISVGYNHIDVEACTQRGVWVTNTADVLTEATADHGFTLLMATAGRITESERYLRAGKWRHWSLDMLLGQSVNGQTLGIIGMGRIGRAIAQRARGFNMKVCYHNPRPKTGVPEPWCSKETLLKVADFVMLTVPYSTSSHHLIGAAELAQMKPTAILINIARGGVVDDAALVHALQNRQIAGAGLDVFEGEPDIHPGFLALDNVVLTPHIGSATYATRRAMAQLALDNVQLGLAEQPPRTPINQIRRADKNTGTPPRPPFEPEL